jgi:hypothetical protein
VEGKLVISAKVRSKLVNCCYIICLSTVILAAEFSRFGRCFTSTRKPACRSRALVRLAGLDP